MDWRCQTEPPLPTPPFCPRGGKQVYYIFFFCHYTTAILVNLLFFWVVLKDATGDRKHQRDFSVKAWVLGWGDSSQVEEMESSQLAYFMATEKMNQDHKQEGERKQKEMGRQLDELRDMHLLVWESHIDPLPASGGYQQARLCSVCSAALAPSSVGLDSSAGKESASLEVQAHRTALLEAEGEAEALRTQLAQHHSEILEQHAYILKLQKVLKTYSAEDPRQMGQIFPASAIAPGQPPPRTPPPEDFPREDASPGAARTRTPELTGVGLLSSAAKKERGWASPPAWAARDGAPEPRANHGHNGSFVEGETGGAAAQRAAAQRAGSEATPLLFFKRAKRF